MPLRSLAAAALAASCLALTLAACSGSPDAEAVPDVGPAATEVAVSGDLRTHDPALIIDDAGTDATDDDVWYVFSTGDGRVALGAPQIRRSLDAGATWEHVGELWTAADEPYWSREIIEGVDNFWAPEVIAHEGTYYAYYSASTFGSNTSLIGLYTNTTLDPDDPAYRWVDQGEVWRSDGTAPYNAIDPGVVTDADGTPWMAFGSFWDGLFMVELEWPSGKPVGATPEQPRGTAEPVHLADRGTATNAIEAPYVLSRDGWYYLFFSRDSCCKGTASTYNMAVGRSTDPAGPYLDADGVALLDDGGTSLLDTDGAMIGPGGQSVYQLGDTAYLAFHYYDEDLGGDFQLGIRELAWTEDGWPVARTASELVARAAPVD
ncbi:arabinan endo-1,5-alpha-L-arabinosidase [Sanguibacter gelidistatuariae]|uniref:Arabinan endo-1,5-alpha-L-arabinosidase n=1 Tax=Sanguibacter gelidistatuariae TaxID=1814289 RepID=A0A1G6X506_9MICO|nr:arabinan endo-1,5-alpha-L-arabinosidase [Sanguibacter gelidistatuariae]SDD73144.1 arabinan endo-1,5-alpha-L-arabinosidase [Sanguibacter gelidistatuariae]